MRHALLVALALLATPAAAQMRGAGATAQAIAGCRTDLLHLSHMTGWQLQWAQALATLANQPESAQTAAIGEWTDAAAGIRADIAQLREGLASGRMAPAAVADRVLQQVKTLQAALDPTPLTADPDWQRLIDGELRPALGDYAAFLEIEYVPRAGSGGLAATPGGADCFAQAVETWTTLSVPADEIEATGRAMLAEARRELARAAGVDESALPQLLADLRREAPATSREELLAVSNAAMERARQALPRWFNSGRLPPVAIEPIAAHREPFEVAGVYRAAAGDASAAYLVNLSRPGERRLMAEVIAFHETLPGHHLAFSLAGDGGSPNAGFIEGWAIYAEYLADEMGLYGSARDRAGMRAKHLWAASRLIVEPGLHLRGWTRAQAIDFMRANTALSDAEIAVEVDRYLVMPGQSLAYMLGAGRIRRARDRARTALGDRFDIRAFHDVVLCPGARPLARLDSDIDAWIASASNGRPSDPGCRRPS